VDIAEDQLAERLGEALRARQIIAEALGVIMEREGIDEDSCLHAVTRALTELEPPASRAGRRRRGFHQADPQRTRTRSR
jgi:hypothetical protein